MVGTNSMLPLQSLLNASAAFTFVIAIVRVFAIDIFVGHVVFVSPSFIYFTLPLSSPSQQLNSCE